MPGKPECHRRSRRRRASPIALTIFRISGRGTNLISGRRALRPELLLASGLPAVDEFPIEIWERLRAEVLAKKGRSCCDTDLIRGDADLREAVAAYLCDFRGAHCHPDQILIVAGMQQAMLISALAVLDPGDVAWIEDPGFHQARRVFALAGAKIVPRPVDAEGIVINGARDALFTKDYLCHAFPSVSARRNDEFDTQESLAEIRANMWCLHSRRRLQR